jgi:sigma-B regulation protein RsbU (phosphoserine phosphatase)
VVTGLRMGLERELKIAHVFTKLNRVIHRSTLSSRFVSVFYAELERNGNLIYVNAGHQPPLLFDTGKDRVIELTTGGTVIGPLPEVRFHRGMAYLRPGDLLVMCTDGILERRAPDGTFFGEERLREVVRQKRTAARPRSSKPSSTPRKRSATDAPGRTTRPWSSSSPADVASREAGPPAGRP